jgi:site-specific recombinase XerC
MPPPAPSQACPAREGPRPEPQAESREPRPLGRRPLSWSDHCPHTLRRSFATHLLGGGVDILNVSHLLGHQDISATEMSPHVAPVQVREAY